MMKADVTIIGGGPGGFAAALMARQYGFETVLVEKKAVGGVCLHQGCIPTKSFIADIHHLTESAWKKEKKDFFSEMCDKKEKIVTRLTQGALSALRKAGVSLIQGTAKITQPHRVSVDKETIDSKFILIATGSHPKEIPGIPFDRERILSSDDLLEMKEIPGSLFIIGAGPTGCEFASLFHRLGTQVTLLEAMPSLLPGYDEEISKGLQKIFLRQGIRVAVGETVSSLRRKDQGVSIAAVSGKSWDAEKVLVSIGRLPNSHNLGLEELDLPLQNGFVSVDGGMRTAVPSIFAVGDVTGKWPLAHAASHQGKVAIRNMAGEKHLAEARAVPECVFTIPEVAKVGWTEKVARQNEEKVAVGRSSFFQTAKAQILQQREGFVKLVGHAQTGRLLGAHLLGPHVTELLGELTLALRTGMSIAEIQETIHPHPTLSETVEEAAEDFCGKI